MSSALALGQLEVGATGKQGLDQRVQGLPFLFRDADQVRVKRGENPDLGLSAGLRHRRDSNASVTMPATTNRAGDVGASRPMAKGWWS